MAWSITVVRNPIAGGTVTSYSPPGPTWPAGTAVTITMTTWAPYALYKWEGVSCTLDTKTNSNVNIVTLPAAPADGTATVTVSWDQSYNAAAAGMHHVILKKGGTNYLAQFHAGYSWKGDDGVADMPTSTPFMSIGASLVSCGVDTTGAIKVWGICPDLSNLHWNTKTFGDRTSPYTTNFLPGEMDPGENEYIWNEMFITAVAFDKWGFIGRKNLYLMSQGALVSWGNPNGDTDEGGSPSNIIPDTPDYYDVGRTLIDDKYVYLYGFAKFCWAIKQTSSLLYGYAIKSDETKIYTCEKTSATPTYRVTITDISGGYNISSIAVSVTDEVTSLACTKDGLYLLTGCRDNNAYLWNISTGALVRTFSGHGDDVTSVALSPDDSNAYVLTGSKDNTAKLWNTSTGALIRTFSGHTDDISSVCFSPLFDYSSNKDIFTGSLDDTAKQWNASTGAVVATFSGHAGDVNSVDCSPDGTLLLTGSSDNTVQTWSVGGGSGTNIYTHPDVVTSVKFSPSYGTTKRIATGCNDNKARLIYAENYTKKGSTATAGTVYQTFSGHTDDVTSLAFNTYGTRLLTGSKDDTAKIWDCSTGNVLRTMSGHSGDVNSVIFHATEERQVLTGSSDKNAKLWYTDLGYVIYEALVSAAPYVLALSVSDLHFAVGFGNGDVSLFNATTGSLITTFSGKHAGSIQSISFSPTYNYGADDKILTTSYDGTAKLWHTITGVVDYTWTPHLANTFLTGAYSPNGTQILTGSGEGKFVKLYNTSDGSLAKTYTDVSWVNCVNFSPNYAVDNHIIYGTGAAQVKVINTSTDATDLTISSTHSSFVDTVEYSSDTSKILTSSSQDSATRLWDAATGVRIHNWAYTGSYAKFMPGGSMVSVFKPENAMIFYNITTGLYVTSISVALNKLIRNWGVAGKRPGPGPWPNRKPGQFVWQNCLDAKSIEQKRQPTMSWDGTQYGEVGAILLHENGEINCFGGAWNLRSPASTDFAHPHECMADQPQGNDFTMIGGGAFHHIALKKDGTCVLWGNDPSYAHVFPSNQIHNADIALVYAGCGYTLIIKNNGAMYMWGKGLMKHNISDNWWL